MRISCLGGAREVGRSAFLIDGLLVDYGMKTGNPPEFPLSRADPDEVIISHGHLDHVGALPTLMHDYPPVHQTPPTRNLSELLANDTLKIVQRSGSYRAPFSREDVSRLSEVSRLHGYGDREGFEAAGFDCDFHHAGHIPGSASVRIDDSETRLLYTGDINTTQTRLLEAASPPPPADALVVESTYFNYEHEDREKVEEEFVRSVRETLHQGGDVLIPVFAIGRTQEILMVLAENDIPCYVDGMGCDVTTILREHPDYVRDPGALKRAWNHARKVDPSKRDRVLGNGAAVVTTSGMLTGGPAMYYIKGLFDNPANKICLTGYQVEGTPGRRALESSRAEIDGKILPISAQVELHDFSAHADGDGLKSYVEKAVENGVEEVLCVHGDDDDCVSFAEWVRESLGVDAHAPKLGEKVEIG
ncbi:MBL fold metallo-hydrolase [Halorutilales archaeon Cl-col2-1]